jgi:hypothetical protein
MRNRISLEFQLLVEQHDHQNNQCNFDQNVRQFENNYFSTFVFQNQSVVCTQYALFLPNQDTIRALAILNNEAKLVQFLGLVKVMVEMPNVLIPLQKRGDIDSMHHINNRSVEMSRIHI